MVNLSNYDKKLPEEGYIAVDKTSENEHFPGLDDIRGFQQQKTAAFPFASVIMALGIIVMIAVSAGLLVYHQKHKHNLVKKV